MDTEPEAKAKVVLKIYIRVLLYLNNNLNNNNINTFLTYLKFHNIKFISIFCFIITSKNIFFVLIS